MGDPRCIARHFPENSNIWRWVGWSYENCFLCQTSEQSEARPGAVNSPEALCSIKLESQATCQGSGRGRGTAQLSLKTVVNGKLWGPWISCGGSQGGGGGDSGNVPPSLLVLFLHWGPLRMCMTEWASTITIPRMVSCDSFRGGMRGLQYGL